MCRAWAASNNGHGESSRGRRLYKSNDGEYRYHVVRFPLAVFTTLYMMGLDPEDGRLVEAVRIL